MLKMIVSVKDNVADVFNDPHVTINAATAIRAFTESIKDNPHKDDYSLYKIADMNMDNGQVQPCEPVRLYSGHDVKPALSSISMEDQVQDLETFKKQSGAK